MYFLKNHLKFIKRLDLGISLPTEVIACGIIEFNTKAVPPDYKFKHTILEYFKRSFLAW